MWQIYWRFKIRHVKKSVLIGVGALLVLLAIWTAVDMKRLSDQQLLWGYRPLWLFLFSYGGIGLLLRALLSENKSWRWLGLSTLSGVLLGLGFPDIIPVPFLLFVGFVPLLQIEHEIRERGGKRQKRTVLLYAYATFLLWNIISTYWVSNSAIAAGLFAMLANSLLMCIPFLLFHITIKATPRLGYASFIFYWITFEYLHHQWDLTWPWLTLGNGFAEYYSWVQWYEYTGVFGGTLWVLLANVLLWHWWRSYREKADWQVGQIVQIGLLLVLPVGISLIRYYNYEEEGRAVEVVVVQPNYEPHYQKFDIPEAEQLNQFLQLTEEKITPNTEYIVYPESSFGYVEVDLMPNYPTIKRLQDFLSDHPKAKIVAGLNAYDIFEEGQEHTKATRSRPGRDGQTVYYEVLNAAIQISANSDSIPLYKKSKLVPGPEAYPFQEILFFMEPVVESLGGTTAGIGTQKERSVLASESGKVAPIICYESVFGEFHAGYVRKGAEAGFIMTNDGWWDNTAGHRQHLHFASLRSIETRRSIARSANTGISAFINQRGDILQATKYDEPIAIRDTMLFNDRITFYVIWGDMIARISMFISILFLLNAFVKGRMK